MNAAPSTTQSPPTRPGGARGFWVRQITTWHWISAAMALLAMLGFALTGITLNHADLITAEPAVREAAATLPASIHETLSQGPQDRSGFLPPSAAAWLNDQFNVSIADREADWSAEEIYLTLNRPGADGSISINRTSGVVVFEERWRGWLAFLNDLHKGRNAGPYWIWFIDAVAAACIIFCLTGFAILYLKSGARRATWPLLGLGIVIPVLFVLFLIH